MDDFFQHARGQHHRLLINKNYISETYYRSWMTSLNMQEVNITIY
jgi:hypothetical protein